MSNLSWIERLLAGDPQVRAAECRADIEDEVADHLQALAGRYAAEGESPEAAGAKAQADFGDASRVVRQCLWIHLGDQVMLRSLSLLLGVALCFVGCLLTYASIQTQRDMAAGFKELTSQLARINEREPAAPPPPRRPELHGHLYLGDPSRPAANAFAEIRRLPHGEICRSVFADEMGKFSVKHLPDGEYFVLAPLVGKENAVVWIRKGEHIRRPEYHIQSGPVFVSAGNADTDIPLDVAFKSTELCVELTEPIEDQVGDPLQGIVNSIGLTLAFDHLNLLPWTPKNAPPANWPIRGSPLREEYGCLISPRQVRENRYQFLAGQMGGKGVRLLAGTYRFTARLGIGVMPAQNSANDVEGELGLRLLTLHGSKFYGGGFGGGGGTPRAVPMFYQFGEFDGADGKPITLSPGMRTRVRLKIPGERTAILERVLFSETATDQELADACKPVDLEFEVIGQEPLEITDEVEQQN